MAKGAQSRVSSQQGRKTAKGKPLNSSLAVISSALSECPPLKKGSGGSETNAQNHHVPTVAKAVPHSLKTKGPVGHPIGHPFLQSSAMSTGVPLNPPPITPARKGEVSDSCFRNIVELFAKRYIRTFDRDRRALEGAYAAESTFSCRFISSSRSPLPFYLMRCNTGTLQGHSIIVQTISSLSWRVVLDPPTEPASDVTIDVLQLSDTSYFVTMLFNTVIEGSVVSVDMVFLLKDSAKLAGKPDLWRMLWSPFVVMSHQIILRS